MRVELAGALFVLALTSAAHALLARLSGEAAALDARQRSAADTGAYSQEAWTDRARGTALKQTSLIIDPPDGKMPPLTPAAKKREATSTSCCCSR